MKMSFLKVEFYRMLVSRTFWLSVAGIFAVLLMVDKIAGNGEDLLFQYHIDKYRTLFIAVFAFSNLAYAQSLREDDEHKYWQCLTVRGSWKGYIRARIIMCFLSGVISLVLAHILYFCVVMFQKPLQLEGGQSLSMAEYSSFYPVLAGGHAFLYLVLLSVWLGLFGGVIALFSMYLTVIAGNRMFSVCIPLAGYYFLSEYVGKIAENTVFFNLNAIYFYARKAFENTWLSIGYTLGLTCLFCWILGMLTARRMSRRMKGEIV